VSLFVLSPESEDRDEVEVELGEAQKDLLHWMIYKLFTKKKSDMNSFAYVFSFAAVTVKWQFF
jgi:formate dehydrogenase maturation protein FdhE